MSFPTIINVAVDRVVRPWLSMTVEVNYAICDRFGMTTGRIIGGKHSVINERGRKRKLRSHIWCSLKVIFFISLNKSSSYTCEFVSLFFFFEVYVTKQ